MVVVIGAFAVPPRASGVRPEAVAAASTANGTTVQAVGAVSGGAEGDATLLALAKSGIGHAAILRKDLPEMEPADLELALRYLPDTRVIVATELSDALVPAAAEGARWAGARLIVVAPPGTADALDAGTAADTGLADAIVLEAPATDPDGTFAGFVGDLAARLDAGADPRDAWAAAISAKAVDAISPRGR